MMKRSMENKAEAAFLELIKSGIWDKEPDVSFFEGLDASEWMVIWEAVHDQAVTGICYAAVERLPKAFRPPRQLFFSWMAEAQAIQGYNQKIRSVWTEVNTSLEQAEVYPIVMKGIGIAVLYPQPLLRMTGDLDLYIPDSYDKALECLKQWGEIKFDHNRSHQHDMIYIRDILVELHYPHNLNPSSLQNRKCELVKKEGVLYRVPEARENAIMLLKHAAKHLFNGGIGLRHLCDWVLFVKQYPELDYASIMEELRKEGMARFVRVFTAVGFEYIGIDSANLPAFWSLNFYDRLFFKRLLWFSIRKLGNFGQKKRKKRKFTIWKKGNSFSLQILRERIYWYGNILKEIFILYPFYPKQARKKLKLFFTSLNTAFKERFLH